MDWKERFWSKVSTDCWLWTGSTAGLRGGYGAFRVDGKNRLAHRVAYELSRGPIPHGMTVDHLCRVRSCVNPDHLELVSLAENVRRSRSSNASKKRCANGHRFTPENTILTSYRGQKKHRKCRKCVNARAREHHRRLMLGLRTRKPTATHNSVKTHCPHGHEYTPENTYVQPVTGGRTCRTCKREANRIDKAQRRQRR